MKTKTFFILYLLLGIATTQLSAQELHNKNGTGALTEQSHTCVTYWQPVFLDGVLIDYLTGTITWHNQVWMFKDGVNINDHLCGGYSVVQSDLLPYEVFTVRETDKLDYREMFFTWHFNLIGNYGSHYLGTMTWNGITQEMSIERIVWAGNDK